MGEIADAILAGECCEVCGVWFDGSSGAGLCSPL